MPVDDLPSRKVNPGPGGQGRSHYVVGARGINIIEELAGRGCHLTTIAKALRMSVDAFKACRARQPEVEEAYQRGLGIEHDALTGNLRKLADDGNVVANLFLLKTRHGYREGEPLEVKVSVNTGGVLVVPADLTVEEWLARKAAAGELDPAPPMRDVTPSPRSFIPEPIEHLPEARLPSSHPDPEPVPRRAPSGIVHGRTPRQTARQIGPAGSIAVLAQLPVQLLCTAAHPLGVGLALGGDLSGPLAALLLLGYASAVALHAAAAPGARWLALLLPGYWLLHWAALLLALSDLVRDPAHWRKTEHGKVQRAEAA